jgi:hypothetical protein
MKNEKQNLVEKRNLRVKSQLDQQVNDYSDFIDQTQLNLLREQVESEMDDKNDDGVIDLEPLAR